MRVWRFLTFADQRAEIRRLEGLIAEREIKLARLKKMAASSKSPQA